MGLGLGLGHLKPERGGGSQALFLSDCRAFVEWDTWRDLCRAGAGEVQDRSGTSILNFPWSTKHLFLLTRPHTN